MFFFTISLIPNISASTHTKSKRPLKSIAQLEQKKDVFAKEAINKDFRPTNVMSPEGDSTKQTLI